MAMKHFRYRKVTPDLLEFMKLLRDSRFTFKQIAVVCNVTVSTVQYHLCPKFRERQLDRSRRQYRLGEQKQQGSQREWLKKYIRERYRKDPEFRDRMLKAAKSYRARKLLKELHARTNHANPDMLIQNEAT